MHSLTVFLLATILALALTPAPQSQKKAPPEEKEECGTVVPPGQLEAELARKQIAPLALTPPTDAPYYLPLTIHMVRDSSGNQPGLSPENLAKALQNLNQMWQQVGIQFFIYGDVDDGILNDDFFNLPDTESSRDALRNVNNVPNTINVYFTNLPSGVHGYGTFTTKKTQGILLNYQTFVNPTDRRGFQVFAHEVGHYFDLYHTHETRFGDECPGGSNCSTAGDLLCDTPADPRLSPEIVTYKCDYLETTPPPMGCKDNVHYAPPTRNLMSYSKGACVNEFTPGQIGKVLQVLNSASNRKNLINSAKRYVDPLASSSNTACTYSAPCRAVTKAMQAAGNGEFIFLKPGIHPASDLGSKRVTYKRWGTSGVAELRP